MGGVGRGNGGSRRPASDPLTRFRDWFEEARRSEVSEPESLALATADARGRPSVRYVLLKEVDGRGFVFYTNTRSRKGRQIRANRWAAMVFYWEPLGRQVRVEGRLEAVSAEAADAYWASRPRESRLASAVSAQSRPLERRRVLTDRFSALTRRLAGRPVPRPDHWSGYRLVPERVEFWRRGEHRLHHRDLFIRRRGSWERTLLQP